MITIINQPYPWAVRGQKLMIVASSGATANDGFRYGVEVTIDSETYNFFLPAAPDSRLYFDLAPLLQGMRNYEPLGWHFETDSTLNDATPQTINFTLTEWWVVAGVLTLNEGSEEEGEEMIAINGYFQVTDAFKPNVQTGVQSVKYSLNNNTSLAMSDRLADTHYFPYASTFATSNNNLITWIPAFEDDYGLLCIPGNDTYLSNNNLITNLDITIFSSSGAPTNQQIALAGHDVEALPVYPANLNDWVGLTVKPSLFPGWRYIQVRLTGAGNAVYSLNYRFYNAALYGQKDCWNDKIRLGWVNSRGGWDYFNFIKKSEFTNEIERKKYRKVLFNGNTSIFNANDRGLTDRRNMVQRVMNITSDYIQENEFKLLRSLLASNQVTWLTTENGKPIDIPVNIDDTSYVEKKTRDGKLYNLTLKVRMANEYWT